MTTGQMTIEQARAIVAQYESTERAVRNEFQTRTVAAFAAMRGCECPLGPCQHSDAYRALGIEENRTLKVRTADIYEAYPSAYAMVQADKAAESRARLADTMEFVDRIAYGDGDR